jgi:pimeloyl-ACP methyl ester carboxylesterase
MKLRQYFKFLLCVSILLVASHSAFAAVTVVEGVVGPGGVYVFFVPDGWNGKVVYFAHGFRTWDWEDASVMMGFENQLEYELVNTMAIREGLLARGFAFALSTYSENGFAVKQGIQRTHQLRGLFKAHFGKPSRSYVMGESMGGLITVALAEKYPEQYDGGLALCGIVGGSLKALADKLHAHSVIDYYYPGLLPGDAVTVPEGTGILTYWLGMGPSLVGEIAADPTSAVEMAGIDQLEICAADYGELLNTYFWRLFFSIVAVPEAMSRAHGPFFDNMDVNYTGSLDDSSLNAGIGRFRAHRNAVNYYEHHYEPTGRLKIPIVTLHNNCDPAAPMSHEERYEQTVEAAGAEEWLVRRHVDRYGHCEFTSDEILDSFMDLVNWVEDGVVPAAGDVTSSP